MNDALHAFPLSCDVYFDGVEKTLNGSVLVVDDDFDGAENLVEVLERNGITARSAKDGREGIYEMRAHKDVHTVILDLDMQIMDGAAFRKEQLSDPALAGVPVIVVSGRQDIAEQASALGVAAALRKPIHVPTLLAVVRGTH